MQTVDQVKSDHQPAWVHAYRRAVGERLREWRVYRNKTQIDMCLMLGVDRTTYQRWERGQSDPHLGELALVAAALDLSVSTLTDPEQRPGAEHTPPDDGPAAGAGAAGGGQ